MALRDIQEDEEILIDYGIEWETAWQDHVANFDVPRRGYLPAFEMNNRVDLQIKTIHEIDYEHGEGIFTFCRETIVNMALGQKNALFVNTTIQVDVEDPEEEECYPCRVVHRNHDNSYIAEIFSRETKNHVSGLWEVDNDTVKYVLFDVPRDTFYFQDSPYERDHHQYWTFRHDMRIPDEILPDAWRDSLLHRVPDNKASDSTAEQMQDAGANDKDSVAEANKDEAKVGLGHSKKARRNKDRSTAETLAERRIDREF